MTPDWSAAWPDRTILDCIAAYPPGKSADVAVIDGTRRVTFGSLLGDVEALAAGMERIGLGAGSVVSMQLPNCVEALVLHLAVLRIGAVVNPIIPIYRGRELAFILRDAATDLLVVPHMHRGFDFPAMVAALPHRPAHVAVVGGPSHGYLDFAALLESGRGRTISSAPIGPDDVSYLLYTSGTEANPKGVRHSQNTLLFDLLATMRMNDLTVDDVYFAPSPVTHITGLLYALLLPFILGSKVCLMDRWNAGEAAAIIEREGCTWTVGATPFLRDLLHDPAAAAHDISSLRTFRCGGADVPPTVIRAAQGRGINAYRSYGSTEHPTISGTSDGDPLKNAQTDGRVHPHIEIRIVDPEDSTREMPVGSEGEIVTRGPDRCLGYHDPRLDAAAFDDDGWYRSGDLGRLDAEGYITVTGRKKDIIIRKGENISAREVEDVLAEMPEVAAVAVVGVRDVERGERVCAVIVPREGQVVTMAGVAGHFGAAGVARQKFPEQIEIREALPVTASGKVRKNVLREELSG